MCSDGSRLGTFVLCDRIRGARKPHTGRPLAYDRPYERKQAPRIDCKDARPECVRYGAFLAKYSRAFSVNVYGMGKSSSGYAERLS